MRLLSSIQMTDRFIQKKEIERLAECSDKCNPLLLPELRVYQAFTFSLSESPSFSKKARISFFFLYPVRLFFSCTFSRAGQLGEDT